MFITDFVQVDLPIAETLRRLREEAALRLSEHAEGAEADAQRMWMHVGPTVRGHRTLTRGVEVDLGDPRERGDRVVLALRWQTRGSLALLFPNLDSDVELAPVGPASTQVTLNGRYQPPLQVVGRGLDRLLLHRVAQSTIRAFLQRLAAALVAAPTAHAAVKTVY